MFKYVEAKNEELIKKIYRFRCTIACDELKILKREDFLDGLEFDEYDKYSVHFAALDESGEVVSCLRVVHHSPIGYPTENGMKIDRDLSYIDRERIGEMSRIFIRSDCRNMRDTKQIIELIKINVCPKMKELGVDYSFGALEKSFHRLLDMFGMPYEIIGELQMYAGKMRYPALLSTQKFIEVNPELCRKWIDNE